MPPVEIFRSSKQSACDQRAFVLHAVGIASEVIPFDNAFLLFADPEHAVAARDHIERYNAENAAVEKPKPSPKLHDHAWLAPAIYTLMLLTVGYCASEGIVGFLWYDIGALRSGLPHSGEWWRLTTALTLHADPAHLFGNVLFGSLFGFMAARLLGSGVTLISVVLAATLGNLLDSLLMPKLNQSIGASTMVFATLGLVSAYSWRLQFSRRMRWAHRWAPLITGIMLLALLGTGGEHTDVLAHLTGFFCGAVLGACYVRIPARLFDSAAVQSAAAIIAIVSVAGAWAWAALYLSLHLSQ